MKKKKLPSTLLSPGNDDRDLLKEIKNIVQIRLQSIDFFNFLLNKGDNLVHEGRFVQHSLDFCAHIVGGFHLVF